MVFFFVAVGCTHLCVLHLVDYMGIASVEWLVHLGRYGSLEELVVKDCKEISQYDLLKFGPGWAKLQKLGSRLMEITGWVGLVIHRT